jgi:DNA invertase Pin-like site-specific DNA recombinase
MSKITPEHLARQAVVYIRQSTPDQVVHNLESRRRQYNLPERARQLGWGDVAVIDDDLGRSGGGVARPGFEKLLAAICEVRVGVVVSIEASRLARNGRDWHTLLEFCGLVGTLIADEDGVYDPRQPNDRLLLGMKGTMSEMELSVLRQRSLEALKQKARRGELFMTVAVGYVRVGHNRIEKDPDRRVGEAIALVFTKFTEMQSVRQVHLWFRHEGRSVARRHLWRRRPPDRVEAAGLQHDPAHSDQPNLCRRVCIRAHRQPHQHRGRPQEGGSRLQEGAQELGGVDPEPS